MWKIEILKSGFERKIKCGIFVYYIQTTKNFFEMLVILNLFYSNRPPSKKNIFETFKKGVLKTSYFYFIFNELFQPESIVVVLYILYCLCIKLFFFINCYLLYTELRISFRAYHLTSIFVQITSCNDVKQCSITWSLSK